MAKPRSIHLLTNPKHFGIDYPIPILALKGL